MSYPVAPSGALSSGGPFATATDGGTAAELAPVSSSRNATRPGPEADAGAAQALHPIARNAAASGAPDDAELIRTAASLTRNLAVASPAIYWADLLLSAVVGYASLVVLVLSQPVWAKVVAGAASVLALYRALSFIHELTHLKPRAVPGFRTGWNLLVGVPLLVPSFMYEGVHNLHHARNRYGTDQDPEYLPLAHMKLWTLAVFLLASALAPVALVLRFAVLGPLSALVPKLRDLVVSRYSALAIDPAFRRKPPTGPARRDWLVWEGLATAWAWTLLGLVATGILPLAGFLAFLAVTSGVALVNQVRTLVAHLWENEGEAISITAQYLDSVNVPPPGLLPALWAPVGLRYHALHHLLPALPYHNLAEAHRRLSAALPRSSAYHRAHYQGLTGLVIRLFGGVGRHA
jgi:fatty acid desaturase